MGDAGPQTPTLVQDSQDIADTRQDETFPLREVNILVTGYGPFKSFTTNPSFLIATCLPESIIPSSQTKATDSGVDTSLDQPIRTPNPTPYRIKIHVHPEPVRVAYSSTATGIPKLIASGPPSDSSTPPSEAQHAIYDYVLHIGMAAGRDNYTLETLAHRDHYKIKDVNDRDGFISGEYDWKRQNLPEVLDVGWHKEDVLSRWEHLTIQAEDTLEARQQEKASATEVSLGPNRHNPQDAQHSSGRGKRNRSEVKISKDAGRFLCEFILYTSLAVRYKESHQETTSPSSSTDTTALSPSASFESPKERLGKVAFLHVPGGTAPHDIERGTLVAKAAITALVTSWEAGYRNSDIYRNI